MDLHGGPAVSPTTLSSSELPRRSRTPLHLPNGTRCRAVEGSAPKPLVGRSCAGRGGRIGVGRAKQWAPDGCPHALPDPQRFRRAATFEDAAPPTQPDIGCPAGKGRHRSAWLVARAQGADDRIGVGRANSERLTAAPRTPRSSAVPRCRDVRRRRSSYPTGHPSSRRQRSAPKRLVGRPRWVRTIASAGAREAMRT